jgi:hypothetical protein
VTSGDCAEQSRPKTLGGRRAAAAAWRLGAVARCAREDGATPDNKKADAKAPAFLLGRPRTTSSFSSRPSSSSQPLKAPWSGVEHRSNPPVDWSAAIGWQAPDWFCAPNCGALRRRRFLALHFSISVKRAGRCPGHLPVRTIGACARFIHHLQLYSVTQMHGVEVARHE